MVNPDTAGAQGNFSTPNAKTAIEVKPEDLPIHCPLPGTSLWNSHPRVYIPLEETSEYRCPYCGAMFRLVERNPDG